MTHHITADIAGNTLNIDTLCQVWGVMLLVLGASYLMTRRLQKQNISSGQFFLEGVYDMWHSELDLKLGAQHAAKYMPFIGGLFAFLLVSYWSGLLPWKLATLIPSWFRTHDGHLWEYTCPILDMNVPASLAVCALVAYLYAGIAASGWSYVLAFFGVRLHHGGEHAQAEFSVLSVMLAIAEWLDIVSRPVTLALRIFANVVAGEALTVAAIAICPIGLPVLVLCFEAFVGLLQPFVFSMLSLVYVWMARTHGED